MSLKEKLKTLIEEFAILKGKIKTQLVKRDREIDQKTQIITQTSEQLQILRSEYSADEASFEQLIKEFQELSEELS